jgi:hypothetical protein
MTDPNGVEDVINVAIGIGEIYGGNYVGGINRFLSTAAGSQFSNRFRG